jgi:hypothetical protein
MRNGARLTMYLICDRLVTPGNKLIDREWPASCLFHVMWKGTEMSQQNPDESALATEAAERELTAAEVAELRPYQQLIRKLRDVAEVEENAAFDIAARVIDEIAVADSVEAVFEANQKGPQDAEDYLDRSLGVFNARFWRSAERYRSGTLGYYVVMDYVDFEGGKQLLSVGASNVVASIFRLVELGAINGDPETPCWVKIHGRETPNGTLYVLMGGDKPPF